MNVEWEIIKSNYKHNWELRTAGARVPRQAQESSPSGRTIGSRFSRSSPRLSSPPSISSLPAALYLVSTPPRENARCRIYHIMRLCSSHPGTTSAHICSAHPLVMCSASTAQSPLHMTFLSLERSRTRLTPRTLVHLLISTRWWRRRPTVSHSHPPSCIPARSSGALQAIASPCSDDFQGSLFRMLRALSRFSMCIMVWLFVRPPLHLLASPLSIIINIHSSTARVK